ncbi:acetyl-CoA carboxylase biotin carboxyl carrier protein subunit [bacterium]|nr:acetyl-CoA carboxylase biotin carboxyl carrier protein subunit [bacterium]
MKKYSLHINDKKYEVEVKDFGVTTATVVVNGKATTVQIEYPEGEDAPIIIPKVTRKTAPTANSIPAPMPAAAATMGDAIVAPMPGLILKMLVRVGDIVKAGDKVAVMEAMKMENDINSTLSGKVLSIDVSEGDNVQEKQALIVIG